MRNKRKKPSLTPNQEKLMVLYVKEAVKAGRHLTRSDLARLGYSRDKIRTLFTSLTSLKEQSIDAFPDQMIGIANPDELFSPEKMEELRKEVKKYKRFVVTTVVDGAPVHNDFLESLKTYCKKNKALLIFMPAGFINQAPTSLQDEFFCFEDLYLNSNIHLSAIKIPAKNVNPVASLGRVGQRDGSAIVASPKQFLEPVATSNLKLPHLLLSTGAITKPKYVTNSKDGSFVRRMDYIANHDHVVGAVVVEIEDEQHYHIRQIQAETSGRFADQGNYYSGPKVTPIAPSAIVVGDYHVTETCPIAEAALEDQVKTLKARRLVFHDFFSGVSINHHEQNKHITRAMLAMEGKLNLMDELKECAKVIDKWTSFKDIDEVIIVESNHHEFLSKHYLQEAKYAQDPHNHLLGAKLAVAMLEGHNPLQYAIEKLIGIKHPGKVRWLKRDQDFKIAGIECGAHGDKGANGSKGSPATLEKAYGQCMVGHSHSPRIVRGFWQVGTLSKLKLHYNEGPSSWLNTSGVIYPNGGRTLINTINGKWRI